MDTEVLYVQLDKETLAIVFTMDQYVLGCSRNYPQGGAFFFQTAPPPGHIWSQSPPTPRTRKCFN